MHQTYKSILCTIQFPHVTDCMEVQGAVCYRSCCDQVAIVQTLGYFFITDCLTTCHRHEWLWVSKEHAF